MSGRDRRPWKSATSFNQDLLNACADNLNCQIELACEIELPDSSIAYLSDRNKYVGGNFYEARLHFPQIARTIGEWLAPDIQFSGLTLDFSNVDGRFNAYLPGGASYGSWIGKSVIVRIGLSDIESTYQTIFKGTVTDIGGQKRGTDVVTLIVRDRYDSLNVNFPPSSLTRDNFPDIADQYNNAIAPVVYGDWTTQLDPEPASVPTIPLNSNDPNVNQAPWNNLDLYISSNVNETFDTTNVWLVRSDIYTQVPSSQITSVAADNNRFSLIQNDESWVPDAEGALGVYNFNSADQFFVRVKGKTLALGSDNIVAQALDILQTYGGLTVGETDTTWTTFATKPEISPVKSRIWENEPTSVISYALSLLEQVRLEAFISRSLVMTISSLRFEDWDSAPSYIVENWDVASKSIQPQIDDKNNFNRARGLYDRRPSNRQTQFNTATYRNDAAIAAAGKEISKDITFPNLYVSGDVNTELHGILKLASSYLEHVPMILTWRSSLLELGGFVKLNINVAGVVYDQVPAIIRDVGIEAVGLQIPIRFWSLQLVPYGSWNPGYSGIVGGEFASITEES